MKILLRHLVVIIVFPVLLLGGLLAFLVVPVVTGYLYGSNLFEQIIDKLAE
jgi:hypothetical protein